MKHPTAGACVGCLCSVFQQIISSSSDKAVLVASDDHYTIVRVNCSIASVQNPENAPYLSCVSTLPPSSTFISTLYSSLLSRASAAPLTFRCLPPCISIAQSLSSFCTPASSSCPLSCVSYSSVICCYSLSLGALALR